MNRAVISVLGFIVPFMAAAAVRESEHTEELGCDPVSPKLSLSMDDVFTK